MGNYTTREFIDTFGGLPERGDRNHAVDWRELADQCTCRSAGPDVDGSYDQLEDPDCPRHAASSEERK